MSIDVFQNRGNVLQTARALFTLNSVGRRTFFEKRGWIQVTLFSRPTPELARVFHGTSSLIVTMAVFSFFVNVLMLVGPIFMLQIYDRVLPSKSVETLTAFTLLVAFLFILAGTLDNARSRIAAKLGFVVHDRLDAKVFSATLRRSLMPNQRSIPASGLKDIEAIQRLMSSPVLFAVFDMPWVPIFIFVIYSFHAWLGHLAVVGGLMLIGVTVLNQRVTRQPEMLTMRASAESENFAEVIRQQSEEIHALGMRKASLARWQDLRNQTLNAQHLASSRTSILAHVSKYYRFFLQSAVLAVGAYFVIQGELSAGTMIAASILLGRALAPIDQAIGGWSLVQRALRGWSNVGSLLGAVPEPVVPTMLPHPRAVLTVKELAFVPAGQKKPTLRVSYFQLSPGQALGVIGPSASGKSTLAKLVGGVWAPTYGSIRLDGAEYTQYDSDILGSYIGYVPQEVVLLNGTIAQNIARLQANADPLKIVEAAKKAGAHEMILKFEDGYDTQILAGGSRLSGGQKQRIGLARAFYGDPALLVLDEPNSNLDREGQEALSAAIVSAKEAGMAIIIMAHRPAGIEQCDLVLVLKDGVPVAFGPRDEVLRENLRNYTNIKVLDQKTQN